MKIQIDIGLNGHPESQLAALIAAMMAYGSLTPATLGPIVAPHLPPHPMSADTFITPELRAAAMAFGTLARGAVGRSKEATSDELSRLIADLNAELYSRRISPDDDPSAGVEKAALNSDAAGSTMALCSEHHAEKLNTPVDLASVFAQAEETEVVTLRVDNQTAEAIKADPVGAAQALAAGVQLDKAGLPWDSRIHAGSKAMVADGTWRQRRGVDPAIVATVEAELRQAMAVPVAGDTHDSPELDADATKLEAMGGDAGPTVGDIDPRIAAAHYEHDLHPAKIPPPPPRKPTAVAPPQPAQATDTGEIDTFPRLLKFITEQKLSGKLNQPQVAAALTAIGIEGPLPVLQARPDLIPAMVAKLRAIGGV